MILDFIYSCVIILGTTALLGALTVALTLTEALQYISYSGARTYFAGDVDPTTQKTSADQKVTALLASFPMITGARANEWITVTSPKGAGDYSDYRDAIGAPTVVANRNQFVGYQLQFTLPLLNIKLPLLGQVATPPSGDVVSTRVSSFLLREPTWQECNQFTQGIYKALLNLPGNYSKAQASPGARQNFAPINDNGC